MNWHKLKFEHWPFKLVYFPILLYYFVNSIRERNPFYFYSVNPGIETGGLLIESKYHILQKIPNKYLPKMKLVHLQKINVTKFPLIIKPNYGERGVSVEKINNKKEFETYKKNNELEREYIVQEYIDLPYEAGIFYYRYPGKKQGVISSIVVKEFLSITGDGRSTMRELIKKNFRSRNQLTKLETKFNLNQVIKKGEKIELEPIGNHNRGTTFLNGNHLINEKLRKVFDELANNIEGFYYGRYDIRAENFEAIQKGEFKVLELNGAKSEPAHIYHPGYSVCKAYASLFKHWSIMRRIAHQNKKKYPYPSWKQGMKDYKKYKKFH